MHNLEGAKTGNIFKEKNIKAAYSGKISQKSYLKTLQRDKKAMLYKVKKNS
jgi:hypothetical protein